MSAEPQCFLTHPRSANRRSATSWDAGLTGKVASSAVDTKRRPFRTCLPLGTSSKTFSSPLSPPRTVRARPLESNVRSRVKTMPAPRSAADRPSIALRESVHRGANQRTEGNHERLGHAVVRDLRDRSGFAVYTLRVVPRRIKLTTNSRMIAPPKETSSPITLKSP